MEIKLAQGRARVFISCGQSKGTDEVEIAYGISERLTKLGFNPYLAGGGGDWHRSRRPAPRQVGFGFDIAAQHKNIAAWLDRMKVPRVRA